MILVTGATGMVGGETARALMAMGVNPRVLVRNDKASADPRWSGTDTLVADFDRPESLNAALGGVEAALLHPSSPVCFARRCLRGGSQWSTRAT
jgi:uncharacterized protein YbjT (DUF2867 family)